MSSLCVDFGGSTIKIAVIDGSAILTSEEFGVSGTERDLDAVRHTVSGMLAAPELTKSAITHVGIAMPGIVDQRRGCLVAAHDKYGWAIGMDIRSWASHQFDAPAIIENDARAALFGETTYGCAIDATDAVMIVLGTGIGTAALIDGELFHGKHDHGGVLGGHVTVDIDGPTCNCGNVGCAEAIASSWAIARSVSRHPGFAASAYWQQRLESAPLGIKDLVDSADDPISRDVLTAYIRVWAAAIVTLCHAYDPDTVVVSGGVMRSGDVILPALTEYVDRHLWSSSFRPRLITPTAPEHSVILGLSALAIQIRSRHTSAERKHP